MSLLTFACLSAVLRLGGVKVACHCRLVSIIRVVAELCSNMSQDVGSDTSVGGPGQQQQQDTTQGQAAAAASTAASGRMPQQGQADPWATYLAQQQTDQQRLVEERVRNMLASQAQSASMRVAGPPGMGRPTAEPMGSPGGLFRTSNSSMGNFGMPFAQQQPDGVGGFNRQQNFSAQEVLQLVGQMMTHVNPNQAVLMQQVMSNLLGLQGYGGLNGPSQSMFAPTSPMNRGNGPRATAAACGFPGTGTMQGSEGNATFGSVGANAAAPGFGAIPRQGAFGMGAPAGTMESPGGGGALDVFSKTEKWITAAPTPKVELWKTREQEVLGFSEYVMQLSQWASQASLVFGHEIEWAVKCQSEILSATMDQGQLSRSSRLLAILKAAFVDHGRISLLISAFMETEHFTKSGLPNRCGFELLRRLAKEFSLRSRNEAVAIRTSMVGRSYTASGSESTSATVVADTVRKLELDLSRYHRMLATLPDGFASGLGITEGDMVSLLLKSLPDKAREYTLHFTQGDTYSDMRETSLRWERQYRVITDLKVQHGLGVRALNEFALDADDENDDWHVWSEEVNALKSKCGRCGKASHDTANCETDLRAIKCFRCGGMGHISARCPGKGKSGSDSSALSPKGPGKLSKSAGKKASKDSLLKGASQKGKKGKKDAGGKKGSKARGQGKKGKMHELLDEGGNDAWWYDDNVEQQEWEHAWMQDAEEAGADEPSWDGEAYLQLSPLLMSFSEVDDVGSWWLLDSGASVSVLSKEHLNKYSVKDLKTVKQAFAAANGSSVYMSCAGRVWVNLRLRDRAHETMLKATLACLIGNTRHNILSTTLLSEKGWTFEQGPKGVVLKAPKGGVACDVVMYGGVPWIHLTPCHDHAGADDGLQMAMTWDAEAHGNVLCPTLDQEMLEHRMQGHVPYHPKCRHCVMNRSVVQHRRREAGKLETAVEADFMFFSTTGEVVKDETVGSIKVLVMTELASQCIGAVVVDGNLIKVRKEIISALRDFGLSSGTTSIVVKTDAEKQVGRLVSGSTADFLFRVERAPPQGHEVIGSAERAVRKMRELVGTIRSDLNGEGVDVRFEEGPLSLLLRYVCACNNRFAMAHGSNKSPLEVSTGKRASEVPRCMFGMTVYAEVPEVIQQKSPNTSRFVLGAYLGLERESLAARVLGEVREGGDVSLCEFVAKGIKPIIPLSFDMRLCGTFLRALGTGPERKEERQVVIPKPSVNVPASGPPRAWLDEKGLTKDCFACEGIRKKGSRQGLWHSKACCKRYAEFLDAAARADSHPKVANEETSASASRPMRRVHEKTNPQEVRLSVEEPGVGSQNMSAERIRELKRNSGPIEPQGGDKRSMEHETIGRRGQVEGDDVRLSVEEPASKRSKGGGIFIQPQRPLGSQEPRSDRATAGETERAMNEAGAASQGHAPPVVVGQSGSAQRGHKRVAEKEVEELEKEIQESQGEDVHMSGLVLQDVMDEAVTCDLGESLTGCDVADPGVHSIRYGAQADSCKPLQVELCGAKLLLWPPTDAVCDSTGQILDGQKTCDGMVEEVKNMTACSVGRVISEAEAMRVKALNDGTRIIMTRWVTAFKTVEKVRARIVAKDFATKGAGLSARSLGMSSPTPGIEGLMVVLALAANLDARISSYDASHAFMHSPLAKGQRVILKLPSSLTTQHGEAVWLDLIRALNGLRDASLAWLLLLTEAIKPLGMNADSREPCLFSGFVLDMPCAMLVYVDDVLNLSMTEEQENLIKAQIGKYVRLKTTGLIAESWAGGGELSYLGRKIRRWPNQKALEVYVESKYLDQTFEEYQIRSGGRGVPSLSKELERGADPNGKKLTPEAYSRFRRALGRLLWYSQTRMDLKPYLSMLATQQAEPREGTEAALRQVLRWLVSDRDVVLQVPAPSWVCEEASDYSVLSFTDSSHAPYRFNKRRGVSGYVVMFRGCLLKAASKQQSLVALSSMESELFALQAGTQESIGLSKLVFRVLVSCGLASWNDGHTESDLLCVNTGTSQDEWGEDPHLCVELLTDSNSASTMLQGEDLPRRSRHIEIRVQWLRHYMSSGALKVKWMPGTENPADLFTKFLDHRTFVKHRETLGFVVSDGPLRAVHELAMRAFAESKILHAVSASAGQRAVVQIAVVEVCCSEESQLCKMSKVVDAPYLGVSHNMEAMATLLKCRDWVNVQRDFGRWVHVHASTPCKSGSPRMKFGRAASSSVDVQQEEWLSIIQSVGGYLQLGKSKSFELPKSNTIWNKPECRQVLQDNNMNLSSTVHLCQAGFCSPTGLPIGKKLRFETNSMSFARVMSDNLGICTCETHEPFNSVRWRDTAFYNAKLARMILSSIKETAKHGLRTREHMRSIQDQA